MAAREHVAASPTERPKAYREPRHLEWAAAPDRRCLYCRSEATDGGEEHILSVALGNWAWTLPPGVICARCNHETLAALDQALQGFPLVSLIRTLSDIPGRLGQPPGTGAANMRIHRDDAGDLHVEVPHTRNVDERDDVTTLSPKWVNVGPRQRRNVARALLKFGLGLLWLARGPEETDQARYDHVRAAITGDATVPLHMTFGNTPMPTHALVGTAIAHDAERGLHVTLAYFGVELAAASDGVAEQADTDFRGSPDVV